MAKTLRLSLTDELFAFVEANSGEGTPFLTSAEFVRHVLREKKERLEAARLRDAILDGYQDAINGRTVEYTGDLRALLRQ